jgi:hypothetical protein
MRGLRYTAPVLMTASRFLTERRRLNLAAVLAFGTLSLTSSLTVYAADESLAPTETVQTNETDLGALLLQAGESALQKKNVKAARKDLIKARKLLHAEKNLQLEARALTLLSQLEAAATNRRLSATYAAQARALEEETGVSSADPQHEQPGEILKNDAVVSTDGGATESTDAGQADALGLLGNADGGRAVGNSDALQKKPENPDADGDARNEFVEATQKLDADVATDVVPATTGDPMQSDTTGPNLPTAIAIMLGVWAVVSTLLIFRQKRRS